MSHLLVLVVLSFGMIEFGMIKMSQVHGNRVVIVSRKDDGKTIPNCDGLITSDQNLTLSVHSADCLPIKISDKINRVHGVIHAGWRGLKKEIIKKAVFAIGKKFNVLPRDLTVEIGPHICVKHYEIKNDVARFFNEVIIRNDKKYLDLGLVAKNQLLALGVSAENIFIDKRCTFEDRTLESYRRDRSNV